MKKRAEWRQKRWTLRQIARWRRDNEYPSEWRRENNDKEVEELLREEEELDAFKENIAWRQNIEAADPEVSYYMQQEEAEDRNRTVQSFEVGGSFATDIINSSHVTEGARRCITTTTMTTTATTTSRSSRRDSGKITSSSYLSSFFSLLSTCVTFFLSSVGISVDILIISTL